MVAKRTILLAVSAALLSAATIVSASAQPNPSNSTSSINGDWLPGQCPGCFRHHATRYRYHGLYMNDLPYYRYSRGHRHSRY
jgi:hypothetical protein